MTGGKLELALQFTLKRSALCCVARIFWLGPDIKLALDDLIAKDKLLLKKRCCCVEGEDDLCYLGGPRGELNFDFALWEETTDLVLRKTDSLCLVNDLQNDLQRTIVLLGEKLFYVYCHDQKYCDECHLPKGREPFSVQDVTTIGTYYAESYFHKQYKVHPEKTDEKFLEFLSQACAGCYTDVVANYQDDIITRVLDLPPGFDLKSAKDKVFNILCIYHYTQMHPLQNAPDSRYSLPEEYKDNKDFIIPLDEVSRVLVNLNFQFLRMYFARELDSFGALSIKADFRSFLTSDVIINHRLRPSHYTDDIGDQYLSFMNWMEPEERLQYIKHNVSDLVVLFLPVWPFQEVIPNILDICFENNFDLDYKFLLEFVSISIEIQDKSKHPVHKEVFLLALKKIWDHAPENVKLSFRSKQKRTYDVDSEKNLKRFMEKWNHLHDY